MLIQGNKKKLFLILLLLFLALIYIASFYFLEALKNDPEVIKVSGLEGEQCQITKKKFEVRGVSLSGFLEPGTIVSAWLNYYQCYQIERGDVVLYKMNAQADPIIKIVKGIPGDTIGLQGDGEIWNILINDKVLTTSQGEPYQLNEKSANLIELYIKDYYGVIPPKAHLLMGNIVSGSVDGTRFGLVDISDIIGKIIFN
ncbi:MAG: signal peptidase I [Patescibacteria group bacterium]